MNDNDLRDRFQALREEDRSSAHPFDPPERVVVINASIGRRVAAIAASVVAVVGALAVGMVWGSNTGYATGRSEGDLQRAAIAATARGATSSLAALRFEVARTRSTLDTRGAGAKSITAVDAELRAIESSIERIEMDLEARPSSIPLATTSSNARMSRALALTCAALAFGTQAAKPQATQQGIPIVDLPPATIHSSATFGGPLGVRQLSNGAVMINDGRARQIKLFDSTLSNFTMVGDSTPGSSNYYGPWGTQLLHYAGDTSVFADFPSQTLLVLNAAGEVARAIAPPGNRSVGNALISARSAGFDPQGRLIYLGDRSTMMARGLDNSGRTTLRLQGPPDSIPVLRADFAARRLDTLGRVMRAWIGGNLQVVPRPDGKGDMAKSTLNPVLELDEFAALSDGTLAIVRGHDYHVDWIAPDGTKSSTGKLPFDWKRISEEEKLRLIDSTKRANDMDAHNAQVIAALSAPPLPDAAPPGGGARGARGGGGAPAGGGGRGGGNILAVVSPSEIPDFYPPIRMDAALPDRDGNLWVLPATSAQSKQGELVYDVINPKRGLFQRVRLPLGRSILGFGPNGVVYLMAGDRASGFTVEKTRLR